MQYNMIAVSIGAIVSVMIAFNGILSQMLGDYTALVIIHGSGLAIMLLSVVLKKKKIVYDKSVPLYLYSAGIIGFFTVLFNNLAFVKLGVTLPLAVILLGQTVISIVLDHYGLMGMKVIKFEKKKFIGLGLITAGIIVMSIY